MDPGPPDQSVSTSESSGVGRGRGHETPDCPGARAGRTRGGARSGAAPAPAESEPRGGGGLLAAPAPPSPPPPPLPPAPRSARMARAAPGNGGARERPGRRRRVPASRLPIPGTAHRVASQFQVRIAAAGAPPFGLAWSLGIPAGGGGRSEDGFTSRSSHQPLQPRLVQVVTTALSTLLRIFLHRSKSWGGMLGWIWGRDLGGRLSPLPWS